MEIFIFAFISMGVVAIVLAVVIFFVSRKFLVEDNPKVKDVLSMLPGVNCGACGFAGCQALAVAFVEGAEKGDIEGLFCPPGAQPVLANVAAYLKMVPTNTHKRVAVLRCGGTCNASPSRLSYQGPNSCTVANGLFAGEGGCAFGCMGHGDCVKVCTFDAMRLNPETGLPEIDPEKCTSCGACVKACPRNLIQLRPYGKEAKRVWVNCQNTEKGALSRKNCSVSCIACTKCVKVCESIAQAITMENNLAYIDPAKCIACGECVGVCPTGAILATPSVPVIAKAVKETAQ